MKPKENTTRFCLFCGKEFKIKFCGQKFDTFDCRIAHQKKRRHERYLENKDKEPNHKEHILRCLNCGKKFENHSAPHKFCSAECRKQYSYLKKHPEQMLLANETQNNDDIQIRLKNEANVNADLENAYYTFKRESFLIKILKDKENKYDWEAYKGNKKVLTSGRKFISFEKVLQDAKNAF